MTVSGGNPQFRIHGRACHRTKGLLPNADESPLFVQIYFFDGNEELDARMIIVQGLYQNIVDDVQHQVNIYVRELNTAHVD